MKLIIGGYAQGKLSAALCACEGRKTVVWEEEFKQEDYEEDTVLIINRLHVWVRKCLEEERNPEMELKAVLDAHPNCIIICDEIGNGIVPMEPFEREYRERTGRILIMLANLAEEVERITCGLKQKLK